MTDQYQTDRDRIISEAPESVVSYFEYETDRLSAALIYKASQGKSGSIWRLYIEFPAGRGFDVIFTTQEAAIMWRDEYFKTEHEAVGYSIRAMNAEADGEYVSNILGWHFASYTDAWWG